MRNFTVKENYIGSVVSEILRHRQKKLTTLYNRIEHFKMSLTSFYSTVLLTAISDLKYTKIHTYLIKQFSEKK